MAVFYVQPAVFTWLVKSKVWFKLVFLIVIAQSKTWAQVVDQSTGITGFMMRAFLTDFGVGGTSPGAGDDS